MVAQVVGGFIAFGVIVLAIIAFSFGFVRLFRDKHDSELFPNVVAMTGLIFVLSCIALVPVDIFVVSSTMDPSTGERQGWADQEAINSLISSITVVYYVLYSVMMIYSFVIIPFAYFFFEELDEESTFKLRVLGALKFTSFTVVIMVILLLLGFFLSPGEAEPTDPSWYLDLFNASNGVRAVCFMIACMTIIGILVFATYTAYGLSALPIGLVRGKQEFNREELETLDDLQVTQEKHRALQARYIGGRKMTKKDQRELQELERKERLLSRRSHVIEHSKNSWTHKCFRYTRPFQIFLGVILLLLGAVIFVSLVLTSIDKIANSYCGHKCGFVLENPKIFNPLDEVFLYMSRVFPIDYIFMVAIFLYFFCATLSGIIRIGIRFLWIHLYRVKTHSTVPQGLLLTSILLMLALLFVNVTLLTVAPNYATFGYQKYCNLTIPENPAPCVESPEHIFPCEITSPADKCTQTAFATLMNRITVLTPFFGSVFMAGHWLFVLTASIGFFFAVCKKRPSALQLQDESDDEE